MARKIRFKRNVNIGRVVAKLVGTIIALYVGGTIVAELGTVLNCTASPFYKGLALIGWTISDAYVPNTSGACNSSATLADGLARTDTHYSLITSVSGTGILAVVGIIGIATIVMEFVEFKM